MARYLGMEDSGDHRLCVRMRIGEADNHGTGHAMFEEDGAAVARAHDDRRKRGQDRRRQPDRRWAR